jgi:cysteine synthase
VLRSTPSALANLVRRLGRQSPNAQYRRRLHPAVLNRAILDEVVVVTGEEAFAAARLLARSEGIVAGVSSGAAVHAALKIASRSNMAGKTIVILLADTGER